MIDARKRKRRNTKKRQKNEKKNHKRNDKRMAEGSASAGGVQRIIYKQKKKTTSTK